MSHRTARDTAFELVCSDVHPVICRASLRASSAEGSIALAAAHGARSHGFTPAWYTAERMAIMRAAVTWHRS
jgi:hypothetical protein